MPPGAPPPRQGPAFDDAGLAASGERARAVWTAESAAERDRLLRLPAAARLAALDDDAIRLLLTEGHRAELRASLAPAPAETHGRRQAMDGWAVERRRMAMLHALRPVAAAGCAVAALAPFTVAAWRWGWGAGDALTAFLAPGRPLAGVALAAVAAGVMARMLGRAGTLEGLAWPVVGSGMAGVAGLAVAVAAI